MAETELELVRENTVVRVIRVGDAPVHLGRQLDNTVVLVDEDVSGHHAVVVAGPDGLRVTDLRSTNGTWRNGVRVSGEAVLEDGDELRLGGGCTLRVREVPEPRGPPLVLADLTAGTAHPIASARVRLGSGPGCHVEIPEAPPRAATLTLHGPEVWLDLSGSEGSAVSRAVALGEVFEVAGHQLRVERAPARPPITVTTGFDPPRPGYALAVSLDAPGGPTATLRDPADGHLHTIVGEARATLLYVLARRRVADLEAGLRDHAAGWMDDEDVLVAVWGRAGVRQAASNYSVLLHRLRKELESGGFDPSFLEKRRGATRLRLDAVQVSAPSSDGPRRGGVGPL